MARIFYQQDCDLQKLADTAHRDTHTRSTLRTAE